MFNTIPKATREKLSLPKNKISLDINKYRLNCVYAIVVSIEFSVQRQTLFQYFSFDDISNFFIL